MTEYLEAVEALRAIPTPSERGEWLKITTAYKAATQGQGFEAWDTWSRQGGGYDQAGNKATWDSLRTEGSIKPATLYYLAGQHGWKPTHPQGAEPAQNNRFIAYQHDYREVMEEASRHTGSSEYLAYLARRGITRETAQAWKLGYIPRYSQANTLCDRLIIPYPGELYYRAGDTGRNCDPNTKYLCPAKKCQADKTTGRKWGNKPLYNAPALETGAEVVFVVEGEIDTLSILQAGYQAVGSNEGQLEAWLGQHRGNAGAFAIVPDQDETGTRKAEKRLAGLRELNQTAYLACLPEGIHDVNDYLVKAPRDFEAWLGEQAGRATRERERKLESISALAGLEELQESIKRGKQCKPIPTGYLQMDREERLGGGLFPGLYVLGAISSLGKTTFALQIADQIAQGGCDVLIFSLEMSRRELIAKSVSRLTTATAQQERDRKTTMGILRGDKYDRYSQAERLAISQAMERYRNEIAPHLAIVEGSGKVSANSIRAGLELYVSLRGHSPAVFIDYLQIIASNDERHSLTDKQITDETIVELRRMSRDYNTPVFVISSLNRASYNTRISMEAFKESGAIEYSSDVLLGLQLQGAGEKGFDLELAKSEMPRQIQAVCLKNRNGQTGWKVPLEYDPRFNLYSETSPFESFKA